MMGASLAIPHAPATLPNPPGDPEPAFVADGPREDRGSVHLRLLAAKLLFGGIPPFVAGRLRTLALRAAGVRIGRASVFWGHPILVGSGDAADRLSVGDHCGFNKGCFFDLEESVIIGNHVAVGHDVAFLTQTYSTGPGAQRAGHARRAPIVIHDGVWLGARCTIMPGVTIGAGAVVGASVVVTADVPADMLVMGTQKVSLSKWRVRA
jgi:maltose O-acetyltransferase